MQIEKKQKDVVYIPKDVLVSPLIRGGKASIVFKDESSELEIWMDLDDFEFFYQKIKKEFNRFKVYEKKQKIKNEIRNKA